jgi:xanthine dehydrogenase accessory factor
MSESSAFFEKVAALRRAGQEFAVATVVARRAPVSAHLGDRAIVYADGRMEGFVGGACSHEIVRRQALEALGARQARLVCIRPDAAESVEAMADRVVVPMTCASEGAVDVYVEPVLKPTAIVIAGATPVAEALARLGRAMRYDVVRVVSPDERRDIDADAAATGVGVTTLDGLENAVEQATAGHRDCAVVAASQGHYDEAALQVALKSPARYVGLVASRRRGGSVRAWLADHHVPGVDRLRNPAGLDLGGRTAEEVALSILGEIVQLGAARPAEAKGHRANGTHEETKAPQDREDALGKGPGAVAVDPVCHMDVAMAGAVHIAEVAGVRYYFCCGGCRTRFVKNPDAYLSKTP